MFKRISLFMILFVVCFAAPAAMAKVQSFEYFSLDVPDGWTASQQGPTVILIANDKSASISLTASASEGVSAADLAAAFSAQFNGSKPQPQENGYQFTFKKGAVESQAVLWEEDGTYVLLVITGDNPAIGDILESIEEN